jgi:hypothetical protein
MPPARRHTPEGSHSHQHSESTNTFARPQSIMVHHPPTPVGSNGSNGTDTAIHPETGRRHAAQLPDAPKNLVAASIPASVYPSGHPPVSASPTCGIHAPAGGRARSKRHLVEVLSDGRVDSAMARGGCQPGGGFGLGNFWATQPDRDVQPQPHHPSQPVMGGWL